MMMDKDLKRFWTKVNKTNTCWLWKGSLKKYGYGQYYARTKKFRAHRYIWERLNGPIPKGLQLDHLCRVRHCVNPKHLDIVTNRENALRGNGITAINARKKECNSGHWLAGKNLIIIKRRGRLPHRKCLQCRRASFRKYYHKNRRLNGGRDV